MSSDYLKQLQLTKQLEQKARELAKERRDAEARLQAAHDALSFACALNLDVTDAEASLAAASESFSKREHTAAVAQADRCLEKVRDLERNLLATIVEQVRTEIEAIGGSEELEKRLEEALAMSERPHEALELADVIRGDVARLAEERLRQRVERAKELRRYAASIELQVDVSDEDIDTVLPHLSDNGPEAAWKELDALMEHVLAPFRSLFDGRSSEIVGLVEQASRAEVSLDALTDLVDEAEEALRSNDAERALERLDEAERRRDDILIEAVRRRIDALRAEADEVADKGGELTTFWAELRSSEDAVGTIVLEPLRRAGEALQEARAEVLMRAMQALRPRLMLSHRLGVDISEASSLLDEARDLLARRELSTALELTDRARDVLDAGLSGHFALADELARTRELFLTVRGLHMTQGEASEMVAESRRLALAGKIDEARSLLAGAAERLNALMLDVGTRRVFSGLASLSQAIAVGADVEGERQRLLDALEDFRSGQHRALSELEEVAGLIQRASSEVAAERVRSASKRISSPSVDLSDLAPLVDEAHQLLGEGELLNAVGIARDVEQEAIFRQRDASVAMGQKANELMALSRELGCTSNTIGQKMALAHRSLDPADTAAMYADVISYATQLIRDELTSLLARLSRDIATARRNGVWVERAGKLSDDAAHKLLADDIVGCHATMVDARAELERASALHMETYNRIAFLTRALGQSGLPAKNPAQARLDATKRLFEAGKYDGARVSANACLQELEGLAAASLIPDRMEEARDLVALLEDLSLDMPEVHALMGKAEESYEQGRHEEALSSLKEIERAASRAVRKGLRARIKETTSQLDLCSRLGCDVASARSILDRAASMLNELRYQDALRAVRFADSEGERLLALFRSVQTNLERAEMYLEEAEERGVLVEEAHALLERAHDEMRGGKQSLALERGRMVHELVFNAVSPRLEAHLDEVESRHRLSDLEGGDLRSWGIDRQTVSDALQRGPRWAYLMADRYEEVLKAVGEIRARALSALESMPSTVPPRDVRAAKEAFERGDFLHCISILTPSMAEEPLLGSLERRRTAIIDELRDMGSRTPGADIDRSLDAMSTASPKQFWELYSDVIEALAVRRHEMRRERIGHLIDSLRAIALLRQGSRPAMAEELLSRPLSGLSDDDLQALEELRGEAEGIIVADIERVRNDEQAHSASQNALARAEALLRDGCYTLAAQAVREAVLARGWTVEEREALWTECAHLMRRVSALEELGGDLTETRKNLHKAFVSSPGPSRDAMADAWSLVNEEERLLLPSIRVEVQRSTSKDGWSRMSIVLVNEGGIAVGLRAGAKGNVRGALPDALPLGKRRAEIEVRDNASVRLFYRPLCSAKEESIPALIEEGI